MAPTPFELLPQADEDALHNVARLLTIESRPYQRVSSRLLKSEALNDIRPSHLPTPPPDASAADEAAAARAAEHDKQVKAARAWQHDTMNELSLLDLSIVRAEFTTNSNNTERERYAKEKTAITAKQQDVRDHIEDLRGQLKEAKENLAIRKTYDELTEKITSSKMLKPRDEQSAAHAKLDEEIAELQQDVESAKNTWAERRMQFGKIQNEAKELFRMIKDEKEEAERKEGMMKDGDDNDDGEGSTTRGGASQVGTPRPEAGGATPMHISQTDDGGQSLKVPQDRLAPLSRGGSAAASPARSGDDTEMVDSGAQGGDDSSEMEEGEEEDDDGPPDDMDES